MSVSDQLSSERRTQLRIEAKELRTKIRSLGVKINNATGGDKQRLADEILKVGPELVGRCNQLVPHYQHVGDADSVRWYSAVASEARKIMRGEL